MASAFGKILKLSYGPDNVKLRIFNDSSKQKCPRYMKMLSAHNMPQIEILKGIM